MLAGAAYDVAVDAWSCGVLAYTLLCGTLPFFDASSDARVKQAVQAAQFDFPDDYSWPALSDNARALVRAMLVQTSVMTRF